VYKYFARLRLSGRVFSTKMSIFRGVSEGR
jgi:hypothetical protein